jgi:hypothetical protein
MALISKEPKEQKSDVRIKIPASIKENVEAYCRWAEIQDLSHFFTEAAKMIFARDKDWQKVKKSQTLAPCVSEVVATELNNL